MKIHDIRVKPQIQKPIQKRSLLSYKKIKYVAVAIAITTLVAFSVTPKKVVYEAPKPETSSTTTTAEPAKPQRYTKAQLEAWRAEKEKVVVSKLDQHFDTQETRIALAIIKEESSMRTDAQSWNCHYDKEGNVHAKAIKGVTKSTFCKAGHEKYAWSVDCGITQQNIVGAKSCPAYTFDMDWSIQKMAVKYEERGNWTAWSAYTSGRYKRWLE